MSQPNTGLPNTIFGLPALQLRLLRVKEFLTHYRISFHKLTPRIQLLRYLSAVEDEFSDQERLIISPWFRGAGLLSDLRPTLQKAQALTKALNMERASQISVLPYIVPLSSEQECRVCLITLPGDAFPQKRVTPRCRHDSFTCLECLTQSLDIQIQKMPWDHISCPECPATISYNRVKEFASPVSFKRHLRPTPLRIHSNDSPDTTKSVP